MGACFSTHSEIRADLWNKISHMINIEHDVRKGWEPINSSNYYWQNGVQDFRLLDTSLNRFTDELSIEGYDAQIGHSHCYHDGSFLCRKRMIDVKMIFPCENYGNVLLPVTLVVYSAKKTIQNKGYMLSRALIWSPMKTVTVKNYIATLQMNERVYRNENHLDSEYTIDGSTLLQGCVDDDECSALFNWIKDFRNRSHENQTQARKDALLHSKHANE